MASIANARDAWQAAQAQAQTIIEKIVDEWLTPDVLLQLSIEWQQTPEEVRALLDKRTKKMIEEAIYGRSS